MFKFIREEKERNSKVKERFGIEGIYDKSSYSTCHLSFKNAYNVLSEDEQIIGWDITEHHNKKGIIIITDKRILFSGAKLSETTMKKFEYENLHSFEVSGIVNKKISIKDSLHEHEFDLKTYRKTTEESIKYVKNRLFKD